MQFGKYVRDKLFEIVTFIIVVIILILMLNAFKSDKTLIMAVAGVSVAGAIVIFVRDFFRRKGFYDEFMQNIERLDKKYLVMETLHTPEFYDGEICTQAFYEINKSMIENVKKYEMSINDFKEYIEMWIHEVKIPIAGILLMCHNNKGNIDKKYIDQIKKIDNYVDQILYYVRGENAENDYLIKETDLNKIINKVALRNKDDILENNICLKVDNVNRKVLTDSKWLEFIINQLLNNSIKYKREKPDSYINISSSESKEWVKIIIEDNGIGIPSGDLPNVYKKTFTGENGRVHAKSTGMGLYIVKNLINRLGHKIDITSRQGEYTRVVITISKNDYCKME